MVSRYNEVLRDWKSVCYNGGSLYWGLFSIHATITGLGKKKLSLYRGLRRVEVNSLYRVSTDLLTVIFYTTQFLILNLELLSVKWMPLSGTLTLYSFFTPFKVGGSSLWVLVRNPKQWPLIWSCWTDVTALFCGAVCFTIHLYFSEGN